MEKERIEHCDSDLALHFKSDQDMNSNETNYLKVLNWLFERLKEQFIREKKQ